MVRRTVQTCYNEENLVHKTGIRVYGCRVLQPYTYIDTDVALYRDYFSVSRLHTCPANNWEGC